MEYSGTMGNSKTLRERLSETNIYIKSYILLFFIFSLQVIPNDFILALSVIVLFSANLETDIYLYLFSLPWMYVGRFSFGLTISLVNTVLIILKIAFERKKIKFNHLELIIFFYLILVGSVALVMNRTFTGISIVFYFFIAVYIHSTYASEKTKCDDFWGKCLFFIMISTAICIVYGLRAGTGLNRWIRGMGYVTQLYGTMGTSRFGLYLILSILYPLYYVKKKALKITLCILLSLAVIETVSMTALLLLIFVLGYYVVTTGKLNGRKVAILIAVIAVIVLVIVFWSKIGNLEVFRPLYIRMNSIIFQLRAGDLNTATSGRVSRSETYVNRFESYGLFKKVVGGATLSAAEGGYSHNSYLDMLNYCGILGTVLFAILQLKRIRTYVHTEVKNQAIMTKLLFIFTAATVSIFSAQYWQIFFFM